MNGAPSPANEPYGTIYLRDADGDEVGLGTAGTAMYTPKQIVAGTYDVYYRWTSTDAINPPLLPRNDNVRLKAGVVLTSSQTFDVDIPTITLSGAITLNGAPSPAGEPYGTVYLRNAAGDSLVLGQLGDPSYTSKQIVAATYDVYYSWIATDPLATPVLPRNGNVLLQSGVALTTTQAFNVNISTITLSGAITINGAPAPASEPYGTVYVRNTTTGDSLVLGQLGSAAFATKQIVPGTYDIYYSWTSTDPVATPVLPRNGNVRLRSGVALTTSQVLNVDIPTVTISGAIKMNGAPTPASEPYGTVYLRDTSTGDSLVLGQLGSASYATKQIVAGTYDVYYSWTATDPVNPPALPRNAGALVRSGVVIAASQAFDVDIPTVSLSGVVTLNGAPSPANERYGTVYLRAGGDSLVLGQLADPSYTTKQIVPGTYDVTYSWTATDPIIPPALPRNSNAPVLSGVALTSSQTFNVDVATISLSGSVTVNGTVPTDLNGNVWLVNETTGDELLLGRAGDPAYQTKLILPGSYDIVYRWTTTDPTTPVPLPRNTNHVLGCTRLGV